MTEQVVRVHVIEWRNHDPLSVDRLPLVTVLDEVFEINDVAQVALNCLILVVLDNVGELAKLKLI